MGKSHDPGRCCYLEEIPELRWRGLKNEPTSIRVRDAEPFHVPARWRGKFSWPRRFWQGAWMTQEGWEIRTWVDEMHEAEVLEAKRTGRKRSLLDNPDE